MPSFQWIFAICLFCFLLLSCSRQPLTLGAQEEIEQVSALSFLNSDFSTNGLASAIDVSSWNMNEVFRSLLEKKLKERGKAFRMFELDAIQLGKAQAVRESRWKKTSGDQNQALMDLLFREADKQGIQYFFLLQMLRNPLERGGRFPLHKSSMGTHCRYDEKLLKSRAYAYFFLDFSLWNVESRKKVFREIVDPGFTQELAFADCKEVAELKDPLEALKEPVHHTMRLLIEKIFVKMGWGNSQH